MEARAAKQVSEILDSHEPEPLPEAVRRDLHEIVAREQERIGG
jgi:trimethylamine:corrinoid methyltransferase-like protein